MAHENDTVNQLRANDFTLGEIGAVTGDQITVTGTFSPGLAIEFRPGRQVVVMTLDDAIDLYENSGSLPCGGSCLGQ